MASIKLGLGTASWYRIGNRKQLDRYLEFSRDLGFSFIDTSSFYSGGRNQWLLNRSRLKHHFEIIVKVGIPYTPYLKFERRLFPNFQKAEQNRYLTPASVKADATRSLKRLGLAEVSSILLHSPPSEEVLLNSEEYALTLLKMKDIGLCKNIGISSDSKTVLVPEWVSVFEAPIDLLPHKHPQAHVNHVFFGINRILKGKPPKIGSWPCRKSCDFTFLTGTTDSDELVNFARLVKEIINTD